ncbi:MAG: monovalent cation/H+ antiporter subunit D family protein [Hyphomicrobiaceae bacterium]|nr:monovalent cation/H+ antiporter subunit D family protein [Hyphomicrobiaceae bacterium]
MITSLTPETLALLATVIPLVAAVLIPLFARHPNLRETVTLTSAGLLAWVVWSLLGPVLAGARPELIGVEIVPGIALAYRVEPLGLLYALVASTLWIVNSIYSIGYMRGNNEPRQTSFYVCFAVAIASAIAIAFSKNLVTMFLAYEALTLSTYPLVTHKATDDARKSGRTYLLLLIGTSMMLFLPAIILTSVLAGTSDFTSGGILDGRATPLVLGVLLALFVFGIGKAAVMPVHFWLPAAMVAPTPVSALLHAVAVVKAGVFSILKIVVYIFGIETLREAGTANWLVWLAGFTIIVASLIALRQNNLKKRLAYSTVSQLSYVVLGAAILTPISVVGAAVHIAGHACAKITLFFAAGAIYTAAHKTEISELDGIGHKMPWTMTAFTIGALAMIGLPPTAGFLGKWFMLSGAFETSQWLPVAIIVASTILNALYFLPIVHRAFFRSPDHVPLDPDEMPLGAASVGAAAVRPHAHDGGRKDVDGDGDGDTHDHDHGEAPFPIVLALSITAAMTLALFFYPEVPLSLANAMIGR